MISGTPTTNGIFSVQIGATNATGTGWKTVSFSVDPGSNQAPSNIGLSATAVPANQPTGTIVGTLSASDLNPADTATYALVAGTGADDNGLFAISDRNLVTTGSIDPATKPLCKIRVRCTDSGGLFFEKAFELPVLVVEGNQLVFKYLKARDKVFTTFRVMRSQNLTTWQEFVPANGTMTVQPASTPYLDSDIIRITIPTPSPRDFFRLEVAE